MLSDYENIEVLLGSEIVIPMERGIANTINVSVSHKYTEGVSQRRGNSSQENEIGDFNGENTIPSQDRLLESMEIFS